jgi:16S rRNA (cytosine967-C5)-methyltransferase
VKRSSLLGILLDLVEELGRNAPFPADARASAFFRARRYLGSRDRRFLSTAAWTWLRHRFRGEARWDAWGRRSGAPLVSEIGGREGALATLIALARDGLLSWTTEELLGAAREVSPPLAPPWPGLLGGTAEPCVLGPADWPADPLERMAAETSLPAWLVRALLDERGEEETRALGAFFGEQAPVDLRVNPVRIDRETAAAAIEAELEVQRAERTPWSPYGLRLPRRRNMRPFMDAHPGWIEIQDEGSQVVVLAAEPAPDAVVIDCCAGAGGKTLEILDLRDAAGGKGPIHACDVSAERLGELRERMETRRPAGLSVHTIESRGPLPARLPDVADFLLVDAPCSGIGTLRRNPELRYRHRPEDIPRFAAVQLSILRRFASRTRPGGRMVYATCSILRAENDDVVGAFLAERPDFAEVPSAWAGAHLPPSALSGPRIRLDPARTGTDGFFVAILERKR